jgi:hypothetical protein
MKYQEDKNGVRLLRGKQNFIVEAMRRLEREDTEGICAINKR